MTPTSSTASGCSGSRAARTRSPLDARTGKLVAVIDFGDLALGDPAFDFVSFYTWLGRDFVSSVLAQYELPIDDGFSNRLQFLARVFSLVWLAEGQLRDPSPLLTKRLSWVRHAFDRG